MSQCERCGKVGCRAKLFYKSPAFWCIVQASPLTCFSVWMRITRIVITDSLCHKVISPSSLSHDHHDLASNNTWPSRLHISMAWPSHPSELRSCVKVEVGVKQHFNNNNISPIVSIAWPSAASSLSHYHLHRLFNSSISSSSLSYDHLISHIYHTTISSSSPRT